MEKKKRKKKGGTIKDSAHKKYARSVIPLSKKFYLFSITSPALFSYSSSFTRPFTSHLTMGCGLPVTNVRRRNYFKFHNALSARANFNLARFSQLIFHKSPPRVFFVPIIWNPKKKKKNEEWWAREELVYTVQRALPGILSGRRVSLRELLN